MKMNWFKRIRFDLCFQDQNEFIWPGFLKHKGKNVEKTPWFITSKVGSLKNILLWKNLKKATNLFRNVIFFSAATS